MFKKKFLRAAVAALCMVFMLGIFLLPTDKVQAGSNYAIVLLNTYEKTMNIGDESYLIAITSNGKKATFSSSDSKVASVNTYGLITAKKAGTVKITAKTKNGEASCRVKVNKTTIKLDAARITLENGASFRLEASTSNGHSVTYRSSKSSVASVSSGGQITAKKPGEATITVSCDGTTATCKVKVPEPKVTLNAARASLFRNGRLKLSVTTTSKSKVKWKSSKSSVAKVDGSGVVTAVKHGTATITATVDGVSRTCEITVRQPIVKVDTTSVELSVGQQKRVKATVSSGNRAAFSSSKTSVAVVDANGVITAKSKGKAYIYASEDGVKTKVTVTVK